MSDAEVTLAGEPVVLMAERALFWPRAGTLVAADFHWGKGAAFRAAGIPVPVGATSDDLGRLDAALLRTCARRLVVLGDLFHARAGRIATQTLAELRRWRSLRPELEIMLVRGQSRPPLGGSARRPPHQLRERPGVRAALRVASRARRLPGGLHPGGAPAPGDRARGPGAPARAAAVLLAHPAQRGPAGVRRLYRPSRRFYPGPDDHVFVIAEHDVIPIS